MTTDRLSKTPWQLVRQALGDRQAIQAKLGRSYRTAKLWLSPRDVDQRLRVLERKGHIHRRPSRLQLAFGAMDMYRFVIVPASRDYYRHKDIDFTFHQVLRLLDDPGALLDPTGFCSDRETITGHVMQVVHLNPIYDLQLLEMFDDGLESFEREIEAMIAGSHPRAQTIGAIIEDPGYHHRLLEYVRAYRRDPASARPIVRQEQSLRSDPSYCAAERTFASLPGYIAWCNALPADLPGLVRHRRTLPRFPADFDVTAEIARQRAA